MPSALPPPDLHIPPSTVSVSVSIIDTTTTINGVPTAQFVEPEIPGMKYLIAPAYAFLIQHPTGRGLVFDLGVRPDQENLSPHLLRTIRDGWGVEFYAEKGVRQILEDGGFDAKTLEAVIWSHWHFDHVGDPSSFEPHTALIVGPGFKEKIAPGWPANPESTFLEADYAGRELREMTFERGADGVSEIGQFKAFDYFGDGSFYLLDTPGHAVGHLCGLARVTSNPDSFIFMGGDACHHAGEWRPSPYTPFPAEISPNPFTGLSTTPCPGAMFDKLLRNNDPTRPFFELCKDGVHFDIEEAAKTIEKIQRADCRDNFLVAMAHDLTLESVVDFFPKKADAFMEKGWVRRAKWLFLRDFAKAVGYEGVVEGHGKDWEKWNGS